MALIKFYKTGEKWVLGNYDGYPAGTCVRHIDPTSGIIRIRPANAPGNSDKSIVKGLPTEFCNESGVAYADLAAFKAATDDFFVKSAGITSGVQITNALGYTPEDVSKKGSANGYAPLDASSKVPSSNLPSALSVGAIETSRSQSTDKAVASKLFDDYSSKATGLYISDNLELFNNLLGLGEFISTDRWWYDTAHYVTKDFIVRKIKIRTKNSLSGQDNFGYIRKFKIIDNVSVFTSEAILITGVSENTNEYILARPFILSQNEYIAFNFRAVTYFAGVAGSYLKDTIFTVNFEGYALSYSLVGSYANEFPSTLKITTDEILYQLNKIQTLKSISGKKFSILGDSISTFSGVNGVSNPFYPYLDLNSSNMTWWGKLVSIGAVLNYNNSIGGTRIYMDMVSRSFQLFSNGASGVSPDIIFIFGGTNDYVSNVQTPIGSLEDGDTDPTISFCSSYSNIIKNIKATYQNVNIVLITPFALEYNQSTIYQNKHGQKLGDFIYAIKSVGDKYGCSVIDLYRSISNISYEKYDGAHPKESLHSKITDAILKQLIF